MVRVSYRFLLSIQIIEIMSNTLFTSESVSPGHPDKIADQISDAILDQCLSEDPESRVACEVLVSSGLVVLAGEITTQAHLDYRKIVRETVEDIGYIDPSLGFDANSCGILSSINEQSSDIAMGVNADEGAYEGNGAGDQGMMYGYACDETPELMPMPISLAHQIQSHLVTLRKEKTLPYLRPDAKSQVTIEYDSDMRPIHIQTLVLSVQHDESISREGLIADMKALLPELLPSHLYSSETELYINPTGRFVIGGPVGDCGVTGRKIMVDSYGGISRHGGGCFSGKDPTKVDRSGAYAARYVAKHLVAAKLARRCEVQLAYVIGVPYPITVGVETFGTGVVDDQSLGKLVREIFDLTPDGIIKMLDLRRPIYYPTAALGHFGRELPPFKWEQLDKLEHVKSRLAKA